MMKKLKMSLLSLTVILLFSCGAAKYMKQGTIVNQNFYKEIPFQYVNDLIIVKVEIDGKNYNLALDTGAEVNAFDHSIASQINFKTIKKIKVNSTTVSKRGQLLAEIPKISIDGIEFDNTTTVFLDLSGLTTVFGCFPIHGLIGNNVMRKCNWQIDYQKKIVRVTDDFSKFKISKDAHRLKMNAGKAGNIFFDIKIAGMNLKSTFDTGYSGKFQVSKMELLKDLKYQTIEGMLGANASGVTIGEESSAIVKTMQVEGISLQNQKILFEKGASSLIGNGFWEHFILTIDWKNDILILDPKTDFDKDELKYFELIPLPNYDKGTIEIQQKVKGNKSHATIPLGTTILKINEYDVSNLEKNKLCDFWKTEWNEIKKQNSIKLLILQGNVEREITVNKLSTMN